jgi:hypothetical protein
MSRRNDPYQRELPPVESQEPDEQDRTRVPANFGGPYRSQRQLRLRARTVRILGYQFRLTRTALMFYKVDWLSMLNGLTAMAVAMVLADPNAVLSTQLEWPMVGLFLANGYRFVRSTR